jgi:fructose-bisphosphate aldolase class I
MTSSRHRRRDRDPGHLGILAAPVRRAQIHCSVLAVCSPKTAGRAGCLRGRPTFLSWADRMRIVDMTQLAKIRAGRGFFAALDQSGGSTPKALAEYGIADSRYGSEEEMFDLVHAMRTRVVTSPAFDGSRILAAILFEQTMERDVHGVATAQYLWQVKQVVPFLKVDKGLADEENGVQLMKPINSLDELRDRANRHRMFGTKMRSVIKDADKAGVTAIVDQQFEYGARISAAGLVPIIEPEVSIDSLHKHEAETLLLDALQTHIDALPDDAIVMLKLTIPTQPGLYAGLAADPRVLQVLALSGGYSRDQACELLAKDPSMIASFSRALLEGLTDQETEQQFNARLEASIAQIFQASVEKSPGS